MLSISPSVLSAFATITKYALEILTRYKITRDIAYFVVTDPCRNRSKLNSARMYIVHSRAAQLARLNLEFESGLTVAALYNVSGAISAPLGHVMVGPSTKNFLK